MITTTKKAQSNGSHPMSAVDALNLADQTERPDLAMLAWLYGETDQANQVDQADTAGPKAPKFSPLSMADLLNMPAKQWIIDQVLGRGDLAMMYGAPGCGKTFVVIDLIFSACLGQQFAMRFDVAQPLNVAYAAGEGISGLPMRFAAAAAFYDVDTMPNFTFFATTPQLYAENDAYGSVHDFVIEWKTRQANGEAQPLDVLIIDTLHSATAGADENSSQAMGLVLQAAKRAAQELGCAVVLVHHTNKGGTAERGSSSLRGAMDTMIEIRRISDNDTGTKAVMHCAKLKDGEQWKDQTFDLVAIGESVRVWWDEPSDTAGISKQKQTGDAELIISLLRTNKGTRYTAKSISEAIGMGGSKQVFKLLPIAMREESGIKMGMKQPDKDTSPHNPMMYWFESA